MRKTAKNSVNTILPIERIRMVAVLICVLMTVLTGNAEAQSTARGLGMGGAFTALARGVHAPLYNPANLGLPDNSRFSFTVLSVDAGVWNNSFNIDMYEKYNGAVLDSLDIIDILESIPDEGFRLDAGTSLRGFSFSLGRFALTFASNSWSRIRLDKAFFEIPLQGNQLGKTYTMDDTEAEAFGYAAVGLSFAQPIRVPGLDALSFGATVRLLIAAAYARTENTSMHVTTKPEGFEFRGDYELLYAYPEGDFSLNDALGYGGDLGVAAQVGGRWTFSAGLSNVVGTFPGSMTAKKEIGFFEGDSLGVFDFSDDSITDSTWSVEGEEYTVSLPKIFRAGIAFHDGPVLLSFDFAQGLTESFMSSTKPQFAVGTEFRGLPWLPLRAGVVFGGTVGFGTSLGIGIRPGGFVLDIAVMNRGFVLPKNSKGLLVAFELGVDINPPVRRNVLRVRDF